MSHVLPLPHRSSLAVPLAALAIGAASGLAAGVIVADDGVSVPSPSPAVQVSDVPLSAPPVPERVTAVSAKSAAPVATSAPVPERATSSLAGTTSSNSTPVVPQRVSGARGRELSRAES